MFSLSTCLALSTWLYLCSHNSQLAVAVSSRQRLQRLLNQSPLSGSTTSNQSPLSGSTTLNQSPLSGSTTLHRKVNTNWPPDDGSGHSYEKDKNDTPSSYHQFYQTYYGTTEAVNSLKRTYGPMGLRKALVSSNIQQKLEDVRRANDHFLEIRRKTVCKTPQPQVVRVKDYFPDVSKQYVPRCTILHRCADETGCCDDELHTCGPLYTQEVTLHFYTLHLQDNNIRIGLNNAVQKLLFINHTECECQPINNQPRIQEKPIGQRRGPPGDQTSKCQKCPVPFYTREYPDGRCSCDCFDHQKPCLRIKRGRDGLVGVERRCILAGYCHIPDCEYGLYDATSGKCPKRPEHYKRTKHRQRSHVRHSHRWAFYERD